MTLQELREERKRLAEQANDVLKVAREANRDLTAEEEAKFEAIHKDIENLRKQIEREERQAAVTASLEQSTRQSDPDPAVHETRAGAETRVSRVAADSDTNLDGLRSWLMAGCAGSQGPTPELRSAAERQGVNLESKYFTIRLPRTALRRLGEDGLAEWRSANGIAPQTRAALGVGSGAIGGYTVRDEMMKSLEVSLLSFGGMRQAATVLRTETGADLPWPTMNDTGNKGRRIGENSTHTNTDISFGQIVYQAFKYSSDYVLVSWEFLQDSTINAAEVIGKALGERIGRITNDEFTTGTGSSQPNGLVTAAGTGVTATSLTATTTYSFLMDLVHSVDPAYRVGGRFMLSDAALKMVRKVLIPQYSGDTAGAPLWQPSLQAGVPDQLLGYGYVINQSMASPATTAKTIAFGSLEKYMIRDVRDVTLVRADERFIELGQVAFLAWSRHDGDMLDAGTDPVKLHVQG